MRSTGIDIGRKSLKIITLEKKGDLLKVTAFHERKLPEAWEKDQLNIPVEILVSIFREYDIDHENIVLGVSSLDTIIAKCTVPFIEKGHIDKIIKYEAEQYISASWPIEDTMITYLTVGNSSSHTEIILFAIPKQGLRSWISIAEKSGIDPWIICPDIVALASTALVNPAITSKNAVVLIDIGAGGTRLIGIEHGKVSHMRVIRFGALSFVQEPSESLEDSTIILPSPDVSEERKQNFCVRLGKEIHRSILSFQFDSSVDSLYFSGGASMIPGIIELVQNHIKIPCEPLPIPQSIDCSETLDSSKFQITSCAIGLALIGLNESDCPLNFKKGEFGRSGLYQLIRIPLAVLSSLLFFIFLLLALIHNFRLNDARDRYNMRLTQAVEITGLTGAEDFLKDSSSFEKIHKIREHLETNRQESALVPPIVGASWLWAELFRHLGRVREKYELTIEELRITQEEITLRGRLADDRALDFMRSSVIQLKHVDPSDAQTRTLELEKIENPKPVHLNRRYRFRIGLKITK